MEPGNGFNVANVDRARLRHLWNFAGGDAREECEPAYNTLDVRVVSAIGPNHLPRRGSLTFRMRGSRRLTLLDDEVDVHRVEWKEQSNSRRPIGPAPTIARNIAQRPKRRRGLETSFISEMLEACAASARRPQFGAATLVSSVTPSTGPGE
jgi:hypothetical protein